MACQPLDRAALSARIPALKSDDHRDPQPVNLAVKLGKALLQLLQLLLVLLVRQSL